MSARQLPPTAAVKSLLSESLSSAQWQGVAGQLLGAFPESSEIVDIVAERHGAEIKKALDFVASRVVAEIVRAGLVPIPEKPLDTTIQGGALASYFSRRAR
tara:strand:- start:105010 stop:105312 length:303 start_codon:yes stop_codon:yes gene_type:complete